jgi:hypothetical protein
MTFLSATALGAEPAAKSGDWLSADLGSPQVAQAEHPAASHKEMVAAEATPAATAPAAEPAAASGWPPGLMMDALDGVGLRKPMDDMGFRTYGWVETGYTGVLTNGQHTLFGRVFDTFRANNLQMNQLRVTLDRPYDTNKSFDIGGRFDLLYGSDARITKNSFVGASEYAILENVGEGKGANWLDFTQAYGQLWFKTGKESGLEVTGGKFVTPFGAEVIDAPYNALYSHSYLFGYAIPFTHTGVKLNYIWNPQLSTYFGIVNGWDVFEDNNHAHSYMAGGMLSSKEQIGGHARDCLAFNFITGPEQTDNVTNYRTVVDGIYTHWWTEKLASVVNADWGTEQDGAPDGGRANWYGADHCLTYIFNDYVTGNWRAEWFEDDSGARIGVAGQYVENTAGVTITPFPTDKVLKNLLFRPELRWDHSNREVFADDHDQLTAAFDVIFKF